MKKFRILFMILAAVVMVSCSKSDDMEALLEKVPSDASFVMTFNLQDLAKKSGLKSAKEGQLPAGLSSLLKNNPDADETIGLIIKGESGISLTAALSFEHNGIDWILFLVDDEQKAGLYLEKIKMNELAFIESGYLWIPSRTSSVEVVNRYMNLKKEDNILSVKAAESLADMEKDIEVYCNIDAMIDASTNSLRESSEMRIVLASLFNDAKYLRAWVEFEKDEIEGEMTILNAEGKEAPTSIGTSKLTSDFLKNISGRYDVLAAMSFSEKSVEKLIGQYASILSRGGYGNILEGFTGTLAIGLNTQTMATSGDRKGITIVVQYKNSDLASQASGGIRELLGSEMLVSAQGKFVYIGTTIPGGQASPELVSALEGSTIGLAFDPSLIAGTSGQPTLKKWTTFVFKGVPSDKSVKIIMEAKTDGTDKNSLETLIETLANAEEINASVKEAFYSR